MAEIINLDGTEQDAVLAKLRQDILDLQNSMAGSNPRNLAGLSESAIRNAASNFGGGGSDGSLTIASGTTTIDLTNSDIVIKQYESISITGTGVLAFSNPGTNGTIIILKSSGDVTITSTATAAIDASGMGAADGSNGISTLSYTRRGELAGLPTAGVAGIVIPESTSDGLKFVKLWCGAGGGGGQNGNNSGTGGTGGTGGGALYIECGGNLNLTGAITVAGATGTTGTKGGTSQLGQPCGGGGGGSGSSLTAGTAGAVGSSGGSSNGNCGGGGGGGGGGSCVIIYNGLTANSGTITKTGGAGGAGGTDGVNSYGGAGGAGGNGYSLVKQNTEF